MTNNGEMARAARAIRAEAERAASLGPTVRMATVTQADPLMARCDGASTPVRVRAYVCSPQAGQRVALLRSGTAFYLLG